jgi:hypothetical protein
MESANRRKKVVDESPSPDNANAQYEIIQVSEKQKLKTDEKKILLGQGVMSTNKLDMNPKVVADRSMRSHILKEISDRFGGFFFFFFSFFFFPFFFCVLLPCWRLLASFFTNCVFETSEESYVKALDDLIKIYLTPMRKMGLVSLSDHEKMFLNVEDIYKMHKEVIKRKKTKRGEGGGKKKRKEKKEKEKKKRSETNLVLVDFGGSGYG